MEFINPQIDILVISLGVAILSQIIRKFFGIDNEKMKEQNKKMKEHSSKLKELSKKDDAKSKKELEELEKEMMEAMSQTMNKSMKMMLVSMVFFLPAFWFIQDNYANAVIPLPIPIPWFGENWAIQLFNETNWLGWYLLCSLVFGMILNYAITLINILRKDKKIKF